MSNKPYIIYGQDGEAVARLRAGSTRFGRTMRAAAEIARYTKGRVFISTDDSASPPLAGRYYVSPGVTTLLEQQARNRAQLDRQVRRDVQPLDDVLVDILRERLARGRGR